MCFASFQCQRIEAELVINIGGTTTMVSHLFKTCRRMVKWTKSWVDKRYNEQKV